MIGLVLAGGKSQRMGRNKALLCYQDIPQWQVVVQLLQPYCTEIWVSSPTILDEKIVHIVDEKQYENTGPIAGLLSAFLKKQDDYFVLAIDYPFLTFTDIDTLFKNYQTNLCTTVLYNSKTDFYEPYLGIYTQSNLLELKTLVEVTENFSLQKWLVAKNVLPTTINNNAHLQSMDTLAMYKKIKDNSSNQL